jgi:hypothetical protein
MLIMISRSINDEDNEILKKFYNEAYGDKHIINNLDYHDWQFKKNPFNNMGTKSILIIENNSKIFGHLGLFPVELKIFDDKRFAAWYMAFHVREECRVLGLGQILANHCANSFPITLALNDSIDSRKLFDKNGWHNFFNLNRYIAVINLKKLDKFLDKTNNVDEISFEITNFDFLRVKRLNGEYDSFWESISKNFPITINRTRKYLTWRYLENSLTDYHFMILKNGEDIVGYSVIRFEDKNEILKAARIIDLITTKEYEESMLQQIINYCISKVDFIDFFCSGNFYKESLMKKKFFNEKDFEINIPHRFNPILYDGKSSFSFSFKCDDVSFEEKILENIDNWYIVKGDSDQDRSW